MKTTKRILSTLLAVLLGLALLAPMASAATAGDPAYAPIITKQPKAQATVFTNKDLVLEVEAKLPDGAPGTLSYEWYRNGYKIDGNDAKLIYPITDSLITKWDAFNVTNEFHVKVTNTYFDETSEEQTVSVESNTSTVRIVMRLGSFLQYLSEMFMTGAFQLLAHPYLLIMLPLIAIMPIWFSFAYIGIFISSLF